MDISAEQTVLRRSAQPARALAGIFWPLGFCLSLCLLAAPAKAQSDSAEAVADQETTAEAPAAPAAEPASDAEPAAETPPAESPAPAASPAGKAEPHNVKLRAIEERVNELKERIFQSKARLIQLQEVVLHGTITGSKLVLIHRNEMGSSFRLHRVQYSLDAAPIFNRIDSGNGDLDATEEVEVFNGSVAPGEHLLAVYLEYRGHGYGVFSYLRDYTFKVKSSKSFTAEEGKQTTIEIVGYEKGGITTKLEERPDVRYDIEVTRELRGKEETAAATEAQPPQE